MQWYNSNHHTFPLIHLDNVQVMLNDENLKPEWVENLAKYSEFHLQRNKKNLVLVIGESWTYGETLPGIATGVGHYDLTSQITHGFGMKLALMKDSDYYQYAIPGNCNAYMFIELVRILSYINSNFKYDNIYLFMQMTEPSREMPIASKLQTTPLSNLYNPTQGITFEQWLIQYDEIFLDYLVDTISKHVNVSTVVWKNFCSFQHTKEYPTLKIIKDTWINFSAQLLGINLETQKFQSVGWYADFEDKFKSIIKFPKEFSSRELDKIEASNAFIRGNFLHNQHPNAISHSLWAYKLFKDTTDV